MGIKAVDVSGNIFSYIPDTVPDGEEGGFTVAIDMLVKCADTTGYPAIGVVPCEQDICEQVLKDAGIEQHRLDRITFLDCLRYPIIFLETDDGKHILADGNHRYVSATVHGMEVIPARIIPWDMWQPFIVEGLKPMTKGCLRNTFSGIY